LVGTHKKKFRRRQLVSRLPKPCGRSFCWLLKHLGARNAGVRIVSRGAGCKSSQSKSAKPSPANRRTTAGPQGREIRSGQDRPPSENCGATNSLRLTRERGSGAGEAAGEIDYQGGRSRTRAGRLTSSGAAVGGDAREREKKPRRLSAERRCPHF